MQTQNSQNALSYEEASKLYSSTPMPQATLHKSPKSLIEITWFQFLWKLFPRLSMEHENLSEDSRLPQ